MLGDAITRRGNLGARVVIANDDQHSRDHGCVERETKKDRALVATRQSIGALGAATALGPPGGVGCQRYGPFVFDRRGGQHVACRVEELHGCGFTLAVHPALDVTEPRTKASDWLRELKHHRVESGRVVPGGCVPQHRAGSGGRRVELGWSRRAILQGRRSCSERVRWR